ncbi:MAG: tetratricopeptide repeat protein, partial [Chloroflexota bacterium]|nr:tetratricopeptide repeat protein [Chloroflexota bacterium]
MARRTVADRLAPLIATKTAIPRRRKDTLRRARLVDFIHEMIDRELFLVVAPAGYGKTTLLVDFASDCDIPVCWYSLSPTDAEPAVFLDYLVASIQARFPRFGADTRRVMAAADLRTDAFAVIGALVNDVQEHIPDYFMVVLDDYHEVNDGPISELVDVLLQHIPDNFKLVISSRTMPRLRLSRLAARSQAAGVGSNDLRFSLEEVRALMRGQRGITLTDKAAEELTNASEGWITGIILTTHTMWQGLFESMIRSSGQEQLYEYLANEVFERQPSDIQDFLLATSILDDMDPEVAGQLAGVPNAAELFRRLEDDNLFVTRVGGRRRAYRYHHLFRDFLRARLDREPERRRELEGRAGQMYGERGEHELAIGHLLAGEAFESGAVSIGQIADSVFNRGRWTTLAGWIDALPEDIRSREPGLVLWRAQVAAQVGDLEGCIGLCEALEKRAAEVGDLLLGAEAKVNRAAALRLQGENELAIQLCQEALTVFGSEITKRRGLALRIIGTAHWRMGELRTAWDDCEAGRRIFEELQDESYEAYLRSDLGGLAVLLGRLAEARSHLSSSARFWESLGNAGRFGMILSNLGVVAYLEESYGEAIGLFETAIEKTRQAFFAFGEAAATCSLGDVYRDLGTYDQAEQCYQKALDLVVEGTDRTETLTVLNSMVHNYRLQRAYAKAEATFRRAQASGRGGTGYPQAQTKLAGGVCALEQGRYKRAKRLLADALPVFQAGGARYQEARVLFHQAVAEHETGNPDASDERLAQALALLEELGYHQFLMVEGPRWLPFLQQAASRGLGEAFLRKLLPLLGEKLPAEAVQAQPSLHHVADTR